MPDEVLRKWAKALTNDVLASHLEMLASNVRYFAPDQREALLHEAALRIDALAMAERHADNTTT